MIIYTSIKSSNLSWEKTVEKINEISIKNKYEIVETPTNNKRIVVYKNTLNLNLEKKFSHIVSTPYLVIEHVVEGLAFNICMSSINVFIGILVPTFLLFMMVLFFNKGDHVGLIIPFILFIITIYSGFKKLKVASNFVAKIEKALL